MLEISEGDHSGLKHNRLTNSANKFIIAVSDHHKARRYQGLEPRSRRRSRGITEPIKIQQLCKDLANASASDFLLIRSGKKYRTFLSFVSIHNVSAEHG